MKLSSIEAAIRKKGDDHLPLTQLICVENTHNRRGGRVLSADYMDSVGALAKKHHLKYHVDGARLLNASVESGVDPARLVKEADSVCLCLSKGLGAPIGSVVVGTAEFIVKAKRLRKALGGGMRQVGVIAAAGLVSLKEHVQLLKQDHIHARQLASAFRQIKGLIVPGDEIVETNILYIGIDESILKCNGAELVGKLKESNLLLAATDVYKVRFVTHFQVTTEQIESTIEIVKKAVASFTR